MFSVIANGRTLFTTLDRRAAFAHMMQVWHDANVHNDSETLHLAVSAPAEGEWDDAIYHPVESVPVAIRRLLRDDTTSLPAYAWPGGYPVAYYSKGDDGVLCASCAYDAAVDNDYWQARDYDVVEEGIPPDCENCYKCIDPGFDLEEFLADNPEFCPECGDYSSAYDDGRGGRQCQRIGCGE